MDDQTKTTTRIKLEAQHGQVWNTEELIEDFNVIGFEAPFCFVKRKSDDKKGHLEFIHSPRFYFALEIYEC